MKEPSAFTGYEYKTVTVLAGLEALWVDGMVHFGWKLEKSAPATVKHVWGTLRILIAPLALIPGTKFHKMVRDHPSDTEKEITFKRDRNIPEKESLIQLQAQFESYARGLETLEDSKTSSARIGGATLGVMGTVLLSLSMFTYLAGSIPLMIVLAVPGFLGWIMAYVVYRKVKDRKTRVIEPQIEKQHDSIYDVCQKANGIMAAAL